MACPGCNGPTSSFFSLGVVGRGTAVSTAAALLMPISSSAITRAVVIDSMDRERHKQPTHSLITGAVRVS